MNNFWKNEELDNIDYNSLSEEAKHAIKFNLNLFIKWANQPVYYTRFRYNKLYLKMYHSQ